MRKTKKKNSRKNLSSIPSVIEQLETRRMLATINVVDFGARPNDGIDDTAAIQAAINASKAGDTINFGKGIFDVANIKIQGNRTYTGEGTLKRNKDQSWIFDADQGADGAKITGLTFDGGGIYFGKMARNVEITRNTIKNVNNMKYPHRNGIFVPAGAENAKFNHNTFYNINGETGIYGFTHFKNVEMNNNHFDTVMEGIHLWYESGENLTVSNNTFIRTRRMAVELQGFNARGIYVENNKASEWRNRYHESFFLSIVNQGYDVVVRNNHGASGKFGEIDPLANDAPIGLEISGWGVLVEGNVIEGFREGMHLMNIRDAVVRNNKFYNQTWMAIWRTGIGNSNFNGTNLSIQNNEIYNPKVTAFLFHGSSTGIIQNNSISLFGGQEYWDASSNGTAFNGVNRAGNQIQRPGGNPQPYKGPSPITGGVVNPPPTNPTPSVPTAPSGLTTTTVDPTQVDIAWKDNSGNETGFKLFRRQSGTSQWVLVAALDANSTHYKDGSLQADTKYYYRVQAYNAAGHSALSNEQAVTTPKAAPQVPVAAPAAPNGLAVTARSSTQLDVSWKDNADNESAFKLFRRESGSDEWVLVATINANSTLYKDGSVQPDKEYAYRVQAINVVGQSAFSNESTARTPANDPPPTDQPGSQAGLKGEYFANMDLTNKKGERVDGVIDFAWGRGSPIEGVGTDKFSVRWTGQIETRYSEEYTFYAGSDDGVRLWIDGKLVIDSWHDQRNTEKVGKINLEGGRKYNIRLEYYEHLVGANVHLAWSSASQAKEIVPASQLSHPAAADQRPHVGNGAGLIGEYFDNKDLTNKKIERVENINFDWREGSPDSRIDNETFSVRWSGQILAQYSEEYTFYTTSDDGVRLWVDGKLIINHWNDHAATTHTGKITLQAGRKYDIKMEYYENAGVASAMLGWSSNSLAWEVVPRSQLFASNTTTPVQPTPGIDLAQGKQAIASSVQNGRQERLNYLTDGDDATRWASNLGSDNEWVYVDLGASYTIDRVRLNWETAFAQTYEIQVSNDAKTWTTIYRTSNGDGQIDDLKGLNGSGRYVKMLGLERGYPAGFSLWSMEVYGAN